MKGAREYVKEYTAPEGGPIRHRVGGDVDGGEVT
jgi:hypothetical protein